MKNIMNIEWFSRNNNLLADGTGKTIPAEEGKINLNWWHTKYGQTRQNLGDMLVAVVYDYMCEYYGLNQTEKIAKTKHLYTIGSIHRQHFAPAFFGNS